MAQGEAMTYGEQLDAVLTDAAKRLSELRVDAISVDDLDWSAWLQGWGDTSRGHSGCGGQMLTSALTVVVCVGRRDVLVYHDGRLNYHIRLASLAFFADCRDRRIEGGDVPPSRYLLSVDGDVA